MPYYVYILESQKDKEWYTGCTSDLKRRFIQHNKSESFPMRFRKPFRLIYYEMSLNSKDAFAREEYLKSGMGKRYIKNRLKFFFNEYEKNL